MKRVKMENRGSDKLKQELENSLTRGLLLLTLEKHDEVNDLFTYYFKNDMKLKEKLAKAFMPGTDGEILAPDKVQELIELQALHNSLHLNLFNAITDFLFEKFKDALDLMEKNSLEEGSKTSFEAQKLARYYEVKIEKLMAPIETFQGSTYNDLKESYKTVIRRRNEMIEQITQKVIEKEQQLMLEK